MCPERVDFCRLLIPFAISFDPDQAWQKVRPDLDPNCLTFILMVSLKDFLKVAFLSQTSACEKCLYNYSACKKYNPLHTSHEVAVCYSCLLVVLGTLYWMNLHARLGPRCSHMWPVPNSHTDPQPLVWAFIDIPSLLVISCSHMLTLSDKLLA